MTWRKGMMGPGAGGDRGRHGHYHPSRTEIELPPKPQPHPHHYPHPRPAPYGMGHALITLYAYATHHVHPTGPAPHPTCRCPPRNNLQADSLSSPRFLVPPQLAEYLRKARSCHSCRPHSIPLHFVVNARRGAGVAQDSRPSSRRCMVQSRVGEPRCQVQG